MASGAIRGRNHADPLFHGRVRGRPSSDAVSPRSRAPTASWSTRSPGEAAARPRSPQGGARQVHRRAEGHPPGSCPTVSGVSAAPAHGAPTRLMWLRDTRRQTPPPRTCQRMSRSRLGVDELVGAAAEKGWRDRGAHRG